MFILLKTAFVQNKNIIIFVSDSLHLTNNFY